MRMSVWARRTAAIVSVAGVILAVITVRVVISSRAELQAGEQALADDDQDAARVHFRRAAKWYAPGNPYCTDALDRLAEMGQHAQEADDVESALASWRSVRASILATRSSYVPHQGRLQRANERIARLMAGLDPPPVDAGLTQQELEQAHLALLEEIPRPDTLWTFVLLLGFAAWVVGAFLFARRAIDEEDRFVRPEALRWGILTVAGFVIFMMGLSQA